MLRMFFNVDSFNYNASDAALIKLLRIYIFIEYIWNLVFKFIISSYKTRGLEDHLRKLDMKDDGYVLGLVAFWF